MVAYNTGQRGSPADAMSLWRETKWSTTTDSGITSGGIRDPVIAEFSVAERPETFRFVSRPSSLRLRRYPAKAASMTRRDRGSFWFAGVCSG